MNLAPSSAMAYRAGAIAAIREALPKAVDVDKHDGKFDLESLEVLTMNTPAVRVAIVAAKPGEPISTGQIYLKVNTVCFVVTTDERGVDAADIGWAVAEMIASLAVNNAFTDPVLPATGVNIENLWSNEANKKRVSLTGISWENELIVGKNFAADALALLGGTVGAPPDGVAMTTAVETANGTASSDNVLAG